MTARPARRVSPVTAAVVGIYVAAFVVMVAANVVLEGGVTRYIVVQAVGLLIVCSLTLFPWFARGREPARPLAGRQAVATTLSAAGPVT